MRFIVFTLSFCLTTTLIFAQGSVGFKTGLNYATLFGPSDIDDSGKEIETWDRNTGFHIGITYTYKINDGFRLRSEVLFSRKGGKYKHIGQMHRTFYNGTQSILTKGQGEYLVNISNSYFELPLMAGYRYRKFEVYAGGYAALLAFSTGEGALSYNGNTALGINTGDIDLLLDHDYFQDDIGYFTPGSEFIALTLDAKAYQVAKTQGAYYASSVTDTEKLFNRFDAGLIGGATWFFSSAVYLSARVQYGLVDQTNNKGHLSLSRLDADSKPVVRNTKDTNFAIQASVGFSF
jgi:hypothetical protein